MYFSLSIIFITPLHSTILIVTNNIITLNNTDYNIDIKKSGVFAPLFTNISLFICRLAVYTTYFSIHLHLESRISGTMGEYI